MTEIEQVARAALSEAFGDDIRVPTREYLERVLAGMFCRQPVMSGDQRARLSPKELRAVEDVAGSLLRAFNLIKPAGWALVPVEPTRQMLQAAGKYEDQCAVQNYGGSADLEGIWDAMIQASPPPPAAP